MRNRRPFIDLPRVARAGRAAVPALQQVSTFVEDNGDGTISVENVDGTMLDVAAEGVFVEGQPVIITRDASGRALTAVPGTIPDGTDPEDMVSVGSSFQAVQDAIAVAQWAALDAADAAANSTQEALDVAQEELTDSQAALVDHLSELGIDAENVVVTDELWARVAVFAKVTTAMLIAGEARITGALLADVIQLATRLVAGNPDGTRVELNPHGLTVYRSTVEGDVVEAISLGVSDTGDYLGLVNPDGDTVAAISEAGLGSFSGVDSGESLLYRGDEMGDLLGVFSQVVARAEVDSLPGFTIAQARQRGLIEMSFTAKLGHVYRVDVDPVRVTIGAFAGTGFVVWRLRHTTGDTPLSLGAEELIQYVAKKNDGDRATTTSIVLSRSNVQFDDALFDENGELNINLLLDVTTGGPTVQHDSQTSGRITVTDLGPDVENTGEVSSLLNARPSGGGTGDGDTNTTPKPTKKTYTKTRGASWGRAFNISGQYFSALAGSPPTQGGSYTARMGMVGFPSVVSDLSGATVKKIEIYVYFKHWYSNTGGTAGIGFHGSTSAPSSWGGTHATILKGGISKPGGAWINVTSYASQFKSGAYRGFTIRAPEDSTAGAYYGYVDTAKCKIRYTYVK